ncbi:class I SAM-dependent methyltransferase [Micromonospora sp. RTP1Z1]|uniref:class I SAM-dependent methyltransferase n=1 Tax=Micromonospora sp. RTP1Z1 TaxID=2994043 RepID=UPI0029C99B92|nr:50S ribosomal protein L11 methyltransferase [Micromonospora sp. RTP1Z1]
MPVRSDAAVVPGLEPLVLYALSAPECAPGTASIDRLRLAPVPLVPEVRLVMAEDAIVLWARLEAEAGHVLPPPFWASAWTGGQALARYILDHPDTVAGRHVLDVASGSGLVAIAAAIAGAAGVTANDIDPYSIAAISANALANGVDLTLSSSDLLDGDGDGVDLVLTGDALYHPSVAARMLPFLARVVANGGEVLVGDPDRGHVPHDWLERVASYEVPVSSAPEDAQLHLTSVLKPRRDQVDDRRGRGAVALRDRRTC